MQRKLSICTMFLLTALLCPGQGFSEAGEIVVYSARNEHLIKPIFDAYTAQTGVRIKFITDKEGPLLEKLKAEGDSTRADVLLTVDAGNLWQAAEEGLLQTVQSEVLKSNIPEAYRDPQNRWFGLSLRARTIVYNKTKVDPARLSTIEALGDEQWKNRLCLRTSKKVYNQSLVAMMIAEKGETYTEEVVRSWVRNLAAEPFANDDAVMGAVAAGQCDAGVVNTYYYGRLMKKSPELPLALFWTHEEPGVHVNISGAGVTRYSPHPAEAVRFLEWLSSSAAQNLFADQNLEYPANPSIQPHPDVEAWGTFKADKTNLAKAGEFQKAAVKLMDRAGYK